jgi:hypothetical protein
VDDHVVAGSDVYQCSYIVPSAKAAFVVGVSHVATHGVHHVLVFRTDLASVPAGTGAGPIDCFTGASSPMVHMRGELYGSQELFGSLDFPAAVGLPVAAGEVLLVQVHFQNATAVDIDASVSLTFTTTTSGISTNAGVFFFDDPFIDIPAGALASASMSCPVPGDITLLTAASHDHARATSVAAYADPPGGPPAPVPFYSALDAANPLPLQASLPVAAGSRLRFVCQYDNVDGTQEYLQGLDEQNDEMCVLSGAYYPTLSAATDSCTVDPSDFGTGTANCASTWSCVNACAPGTAPPADLGLSTAPDVDPCWQRCVVASCPATSTPLFALVRCVQSNCATQCAVPTADECAACQAAACSTESSACTGDPPCGG